MTEMAKRYRREKRTKKVNYTKVKKGMRSKWGRERWWKTDEERKRAKKEKKMKWCSRDLATVIFWQNCN